MELVQRNLGDIKKMMTKVYNLQKRTSDISQVSIYESLSSIVSNDAAFLVIH